MAKKIQKNDIKKAILGSMGIMSTIARRLGVEWHTAKKKIYEDEELIRCYKNENETQIDFAESNLMKNIKAGDTTATIFYLKTKGKKRGYVEKQEIDATANFTIIKSEKVKDDL